MLKVVHISKYYYPSAGGIEYYLKDFAEYSTSCYNDKHFIISYAEGRRRYEVTDINDVSVYRFPVDFNFSYAPISISMLTNFKALISEIKPDIIHVHMPNAMPLFMNLTACRCPIVVHWHSDVVKSQISKSLRYLYDIYGIFERKLLEKADKIIATSDNYAESSGTLKKYLDKVMIAPLGINDVNTPEMPIDIDFGNGEYLLSIGRLTYYKGYEYLIRSMKYVDKDIKLIIAGSGSEEDRLRSVIKKEGLERRVVLAGYVKDKQKYQLIKNCKLFCLPSIERTEAFGVSLLEAMCFEKALITGKVEGSGMNLVNIDGETGLHVICKDVLDLSEKINYLLANDEIINEMGKNGRKRFEEMFSIDKSAKAVRRVYDSIVKKCVF